MRTVQELFQNNISREEMTNEELKAYIHYWFEKYEKEGFSKVFISPYDGEKHNNGRRFNLIRRCKNIDEDAESGADLSCQPLWLIQFDNEEPIAAYPEEIIPSEIRDNIWREKDKQYLDMM